MAKALKSSLQTVVYDPPGELDMEEAMPFEVTLDNTSFYLERASPQRLQYVEEVLGEEDVQGSSTLEISAFRAKVPLEKRQEFTRNENDDLVELQTMEITSLPALEVDSLQAFPVIISGVDRTLGDSVMVYQLWLFSEEGYYLYKARTKEHFEGKLKLFQQIGATFDRK